MTAQRYRATIEALDGERAIVLDGPGVERWIVFIEATTPEALARRIVEALESVHAVGVDHALANVRAALGVER